MRDAAIVRMTLRELAPLHLGALAIGMLVAMSQLDDFHELSESPNTWPLCVLPAAALWGGLTIGGGTNASLVHLLARPVSRLRVLAWRWGLLLAGLAIVALPLWWIGLHQFGRGPGLWSLAITTLLASTFGAQGGALSERESYAIAGALLLGGALVLPVQLAIEAEQTTWTRMNSALGWWWLVPLVAAFALQTAPVGWTWARALPLRSMETGARTVLSSFASSLFVVLAIITPMLSWVAAPQRGELLMVVAMARDGLVVATGTRGEDADRDVLDGLVVISDDGERTTIWSRHDDAPGQTVWYVRSPEHSLGEPRGHAIRLGIVDGDEPDAAHPPREIEIPIDLVGDDMHPATVETLNRTHAIRGWHAAFGPADGPVLAVRQTRIDVVDPTRPNQATRPFATVYASDVRWKSSGGYAIADGRVWFLNEHGALSSAPVPREVLR